MRMNTEMDKNNNISSSIISSVSKQDSYALNYWWESVLGCMKLLLQTFADWNDFMPTDIVQKNIVRYTVHTAV